MEKNKIWRFVFAAFMIGMLGTGGFSCSLLTGPKNSSNGDLTLEDVACVKSWLKVDFGTAGGDYEIKRDGNVVLTGSYAGDTVVVDTTVEPSRSYTYEAELISDGKVLRRSSPVEVTTLDTTSSDYTFRTWEFGGIVPGSYLNDVTIVNDTDIWAAGEINMKDSSSSFNAVHWDGHKWVLHTIYFSTVCGQPELTAYPARAITVTGETGFTIAGAGQLVKVNGSSQGIPMCDESPIPFGINTLWSDSYGKLYLGGNGGQIQTYNGTTWRSLSSGTSTSIDDIWGKIDAETGKQVILAAVSNGILVQGGERGIIEIHKDGTVTKIPWSPNRDVLSVWFSSLQNIYTAGDGIYNGNGTSWRLALPLAGQDYTARVRGNGANDILVVGDYGYCVHFNGVSWQTYPQISLPNGGYSGLSVKGNTMCAVGYSNNYAVIALGTRD